MTSAVRRPDLEPEPARPLAVRLGDMCLAGTGPVWVARPDADGNTVLYLAMPVAAGRHADAGRGWAGDGGGGPQAARRRRAPHDADVRPRQRVADGSHVSVAAPAVRLDLEPADRLAGQGRTRYHTTGRPRSSRSTSHRATGLGRST